MGDVNTEIGSASKNLEDIMGKHDLGEINKKVELLTNFFANNNYVVGGLLFSHKRIHKVTRLICVQKIR